MSAYNACACVPSFSKGGAGVVCDITRKINSPDSRYYKRTGNKGTWLILYLE